MNAMKLIYTLIICGFGLIASVSCGTDDVRTLAETQGFYAEITAKASCDTRISLEDGLQPVWNDSDAIAVYAGSTKCLFEIKSNYGSSAVFSGTLSTASDTYYGAYPYQSASTISNGSILVDIPAVQSVAEGASTALGALVSVAKFIDIDDVRFIPATGLVRFSITEEVTSVRISGTNGETLAGTARINASDGSISYFTAAEASVTLCAESGTLPAGTYCFAVAPQTLSNGFTFEVTDAAGGIQTLTGTGAISIGQGSCISLGNITYLLESTQAPTGGGTIMCGGESVSFDRTVSISFGEYSSARVSGASGLDVEIAGNDVIITNGGKDKVMYSLSGSTSSGDIKIYGTAAQAIILNDVSITNPFGAAINNQNKKKSTYIVLNGTNSLSDGSSASYDGASADAKAVLFSENNLRFCGGGSLFVTAMNSVGKSGIVSDDEVEIFSGPDLTVDCGSSAGHGIKGKDGVTIAGGTVTVTVEGSAKKAITSEGIVSVSGGSTCLTATGDAAYDSEDGEFKTAAGIKGDSGIEIDGGILDINTTGTGSSGLNSDDYIVCSGGTTTITVSGGVYYDSSEGEYKGSAGVKPDNYFGMTGGVLAIENTGDGGKGINAGSYDFDATGHTLSDSYISGGRLTVECTGSESNDVSAKGIKVGWATKSGTGEHATVTGYAGNLEITGGIVNVYAYGGEGIEAKGTLTITDGCVYAYSAFDDGINSLNDMTISGGYVCAWTDGTQVGADGFDSNGDLYIQGGVVYGVCIHGGPDVAFDANSEERKKLYVEEGTLIAVGGLERGASVTGNAYNVNSWRKDTWYGLWDSSSNAVVAFRTPSVGSQLLVYSDGGAVRLKYGVSFSGTYVFDGYACMPGSISGGSNASLSTYQTGPGGPGWH